MFYNCSSLISLNLINFNTSKISYYSEMFYNVNEKIDFCFDISKNSKISSQIENFNINCTNFVLLKKIRK